MRIENAALPRLQTQEREATKTKQENFAQMVARSEKENKLTDISERFAQIAQQEELCLKHTDLTNLVKYKEMVSSFLKETVGGGFCCCKDEYASSFGRGRALCVVQTAEQKLADLTADFISGQQGGIDLLARMDDIRGLLVDLFY